MKHEIYPKEWERGKILRIIYPDKNGEKIEPERHFAALMFHIKKQAVEEYDCIID